MNQQHWFYIYVLPLIPTLLTVAGWYIVHRREYSKRIDERKNKRIDSCLDLLKKIEQGSLNYYSLSPEETLESGTEIVWDLKKLAQWCNKISPDLNRPLMDLRTEITGGDFQSQKRVPLPKTNKKFLLIRQHIFQLVIKLDDCYDK